MKIDISKICFYTELIKIFTFSSILWILIIGCTPTQEALKPIDPEKRLKVKIFPFDDLTGTYDKASEHLENRATAFLDSDFIQIVKNFSRKKLAYPLITYPNPFKGVSKNDTPSLAFYVKGEVERCSYEKYADINTRIASYHLLGILGLANYHDVDLCGFSQFRVKIYNAQNKLIDSSVIFGASCGNVLRHSRKELIDRAIAQASYNFYKYLFESLVDKFQMHLKYRVEEIDEDRANQIRYIYVDN
jgi:hypothetical protein